MGPIDENADAEAQLKEDEDDVAMYFRELEKMSEVPHMILFSNQNIDELSEEDLHVFTAKPNKNRQKQIFNFLPKEVDEVKKSILEGKTNLSSCNPFNLLPPMIQMDSGATPIFKVVPRNLEEFKNEGNSHLTYKCSLLASWQRKGRLWQVR